jgi:hypothetical protein
MIAGECANHRNGACLGMDIRVDKATGEVSYPRLELPKCLVAMRLPCRYFERCLMPLCAKRQEYAGAGNEYATRTGRPVKTVIDGLEDEDLRALLMRHPFVGHSQTLAHMDRNTRYCKCGEPLLKGKQMCLKCRKERKRQAVREAMKRNRMGYSVDPVLTASGDGTDGIVSPSGTNFGSHVEE